MTDEDQCSTMVSGSGSWGSFHQHHCHKQATIQRDGKWYCKIHDPEYIKEKNKVSTAKHNEQWRKRRIELSGHRLLRACKEALEASHNPTVEKILTEAINEAERQS